MILDLLFPPKCILCGRVLENGELDLCRSCRIDSPECADTQRKLPFLNSCTAVWYYEGSARQSLLRYKFRGTRAYAQGYARLLAMKLLEAHPDGFDIVTWVPVSFLRKLKRGFDQVELLSQHISAETGIPSVKLIRKIRHNRPQSGIQGDAQRRANVLGAYQVLSPEKVAGKRILLLDDIVTTGATAGEVARVLLTAGAKEVHFGAVAMARRNANKS